MKTRILVAAVGLPLILLVLYICLSYIFYHYTDSLPLRTLELVLYGWMFCFGSLFIMTTKLAAPVYSDSFIVTNAAMEAAQAAQAQ